MSWDCIDLLLERLYTTVDRTPFLGSLILMLRAKDNTAFCTAFSLCYHRLNIKDWAVVNKRLYAVATVVCLSLVWLLMVIGSTKGL